MTGRAPLLVVSGTGTGIGKTHLTAALVTAWSRVLAGAKGTAKVAGLKPIESGVSGDGHGSDAEILDQASTFHVKHPAPPYRLERPVSPHLAARAEGRTIELAVVRAYVDAVRTKADAVAVELPGGLFSPLGAALNNAGLALELQPTAILLVAPDRLGVLHEVAATTRAAAAMGLNIGAIAMVAPQADDASTGTNAAELAVVTALPVLGPFPRTTIVALAKRPDLFAYLQGL